MNNHAGERVRLLERLGQLDPPGLLDTVAWWIAMPLSLRPSPLLPRAERARQIVEWAEAENGCGLACVADALERLAQRRITHLPPPWPPPRLLPRGEDLDRLTHLLLHDGRPVIALRGMGGCGKTVLAACAARKDAVQESYPEGVFWLTVGQAPHTLDLQTRLAEAAGVPTPHFRDEQQATAALRHWFAGRRALLVLDDVWSAAPACALAVMDAGRLLITTRDAGVLTDLDAVEAPLGLLSEEESLALLTTWTGDAATMGADEAVVREVIRRCGRLPLAIAVCGALVRDGQWWSDVRDALSEADRTVLEREQPDYAYRSLARSLAAGEQRLCHESPRAVDRYRELAVFPADASVPESAVAALWGQTGGLAPRDSRNLLTQLARLALLTLEGDSPQRRVVLHDLQRDYLASRVANGPALHRALLDGYAAACEGDWVHGPDDGYFFAHLADHLEQAHRGAELLALLLDYRWLDARLRASSPASLLADFEIAQRALQAADAAAAPLAAAAAAVQSALRLAAHVLSEDADQLAGQLEARLDGDDHAPLRQLRADLATLARRPRLRPRSATLTSPGGPLVRTLVGHQGAVFAVAAAMDKPVAVSASADGAVKIWDWRTGAELATLCGHEDLVRAVSVSADGRRAISGAWDGSVTVWDLEARQACSTFPRLASRVIALAMTPDGRTAVSACEDGAVVAWDVASCRPRRRLRDGGPAVRALAITPDGQAVLMGGSDGAVAVHRLEEGGGVRLLQREGEAVEALAVTRDGRTALGATRAGALHVWDLANHRPRAVLQEEDAPLHAVAVTSDGRWAVTTSAAGVLARWDLQAGRLEAAIPAHAGAVYAVALAHDGQTVITGALDGSLRIWSLGALDGCAAKPPDEQPAPSSPFAPRKDVLSRSESRHFLPQRVVALALSTDGRRALSGAADGTLVEWDVEAAKRVRVLAGEGSAVLAVGMPRADNPLVVAQYADGQVHVGDLNQRRCMALRRPTPAASVLAMTPNGRTTVTALPGGHLHVWRASRPRTANTLPGHDGEVQAIAVTPDGRLAVSLGEFDRMLKIWDLEAGQEAATLPGGDDPLLSVAVTADGCWAVSGSENGLLTFWNVRQPRMHSRLGRRSEPVTAVAVTPDGRQAVSGELGGAIALWSRESPHPVAKFTVEAAVRACAVIPNGRTIVAGDDAGSVHFLDLLPQDA